MAVIAIVNAANKTDSSTDSASTTTEAVSFPESDATSTVATTAEPPQPSINTAPPPPPGPAESWVMPNFVGANLQAAQDSMQALTGNPLFFTSSTDLTGQGRAQILDRNWQVCSQSLPPGTTFETATISDFGVVMNEEACP